MMFQMVQWLGMFFIMMGVPFPIDRLYPGKTEQLYTDAIGTNYVLSADGTLTKYNPDKKLLFSQNIRIYGALTSIDCGNPMETYLFFNNSGKIVFLDNTLSQRGIVDLNDGGMPLIQAACRSYDNQIWAFDPVDQQLKHIDRQLNILHQSGNVQLFANGSFQVNSILDNGTWVFMLTSEGSLLQFDQTANFQKRMPKKELKWVTWVNENWMYWQGDSLYEADASMRLSKGVTKIPEGTKQIAVSIGKFYALRGDSVLEFK